MKVASYYFEEKREVSKIGEGNKITESKRKKGKKVVQKPTTVDLKAKRITFFCSLPKNGR